MAADAQVVPSTSTPQAALTQAAVAKDAEVQGETPGAAKSDGAFWDNPEIKAFVAQLEKALSGRQLKSDADPFTVPYLPEQCRRLQGWAAKYDAKSARREALIAGWTHRIWNHLEFATAFKSTDGCIAAPPAATTLADVPPHIGGF